MKIIGITGGVGAGKTQILEYLSDKYGASVCQTDKVAKKLQKKGGICYDPIVEHFGTEILSSITKLYFYQVSGHSIITDKWMITIALIMKVKGSAFLFAVCIKESGIQIQNNSLWHLNTVNFPPKYSGNRKELV